jgi:hypothetical protein
LFCRLSLGRITTLALTSWLAATPALGVPLTTVFADLARCDPLSGPDAADELGLAPPFPDNERIDAISSGSTQDPICLGFTGTQQRVTMTNLTGRSFAHVWYAAEPSTTFTNYDGTINGLFAFKIDSVGSNPTLISESLAANGIFEPSEVWRFQIEDYSSTAGLPASAFLSIGAPSGGGSGSSGSIIGIVPEPSTALLLGVGLAGLAFLRRRQQEI